MRLYRFLHRYPPVAFTETQFVKVVSCRNFAIKPWFFHGFCVKLGYGIESVEVDAKSVDIVFVLKCEELDRDTEGLITPFFSISALHL